MTSYVDVHATVVAYGCQMLTVGVFEVGFLKSQKFNRVAFY